MSKQQQGVEASSAHDQRLILLQLLLQLYVIGLFAWRILTPAHEFQLRGEQALTIGLDILGLIALVGLRARAPNGTAPFTKALFWLAVAAGVGSLGLRLISDEGWWTGHLFYTLLPS